MKRACIFTLFNFGWSISLATFMQQYIEIMLIQLFLVPIGTIVLALAATRHPLWAPLIVFTSGLTYTVCYSIYNYDTFIIYNHFSDIFDDLAFVSAVLTFIPTLFLFQMKRARKN
ncbi:hypothetical protein [Neobacillus sp. 19]|uniref:hypothetical protein n=1 Tax=Neobacillus sp. 19 TaxID=3394458 RepID=UPI003BF6A376